MHASDRRTHRRTHFSSLVSAGIPCSAKKIAEKYCPAAQQLVDFFKANAAAVRRTSDGGDTATELPPASETFDHFQPCTASGIKSVIRRLPSKSCMLVPYLMT